jgi:hypothetical protein
MEQLVWNYYIDTVLAPEIENQLLLMVDNLDCHVLAESVIYCVEQFGSEMCLLPENTTTYY